MNVEILILTSEKCTPCKALISSMKKRGILFRELDENNDESIRYRDLLGFSGAPITLIKSEYDLKILHGNGDRTIDRISSVAQKHNLYF